MSPTPAPTALVNGEQYPLDATTGVEDLVAALVPAYVTDGSPQGVAVAINDAVVPRGTWSSTVVTPGDRVEIVTAVQGG